MLLPMPWMGEALTVLPAPITAATDACHFAYVLTLLNATTKSRLLNLSLTMTSKLLNIT